MQELNFNISNVSRFKRHNDNKQTDRRMDERMPSTDATAVVKRQRDDKSRVSSARRTIAGRVVLGEFR